MLLGVQCRLLSYILVAPPAMCYMFAAPGEPHGALVLMFQPLSSCGCGNSVVLRQFAAVLHGYDLPFGEPAQHPRANVIPRQYSAGKQLS